MNFKKTAAALAMGMMVSGGAMAQTVINVPDMETNFDFGTVGATTFADIAAAVSSTANVSALAASFNEAGLYGAITIEGATISFSAIENVTASANATSSNVEAATASATAINGNSLSTTVIGAMNTAELENKVHDLLSTDFAAQEIFDPAGAQTADLTDLAGLGALTAELGDVSLASASVNAGAIAGNIAIVASNSTPTWFLNEATVASVNLTNLEAATTVIGAMNTTNALSEVVRDVNLKTAIQVVAQ